MRRWVTIIGLAAVSAVALAGCSVPAGTDGNLVDDWPAVGEPKMIVPTAGVCYAAKPGATWDATTDQPVPCTTSHAVETIYVGSYTGDAAKRTTTPPAGGPEQRAAYATCSQKANDFLGADWHTGLVMVNLVEPDNPAWKGGARWFRCDVMSTDGYTFKYQMVSWSLKDGLRGARSLANTCFDATETSDGRLGEMRPVDCAKPHRGEFAGLYTAPTGAYPGDNDKNDPAESGCEHVVGKYVGSAWGRRSDLGWFWNYYNENQWELGDRTVLCYAVAFNGEHTRLYRGTLKNIGSAPLKS
ncbi:MAG TPA: septum formation family protein [Micromonosporaceae bacterium]